MKRQQSGFTLVEIAIVMVIIGLLLGGVLKGQEVITNARIKNVTNDFSGVSAAIYSYQDRYATLPGDDGAADAHVGGLISTAATTENGIIEGGLGSVLTAAGIAAGDPEAAMAWVHLRLAGLISGAVTSTALPTNTFGGNMIILTGDGAGGAINGITGLFVGFTGIPGDMAVILDAQNDDGNPNTGTIRAVAATVGAIPTPGNYVFTTNYTLAFEL
ncbi:MAG: prepilin-type N-terminal cleavage/methylation domain-containing protein [Gammaproteobacteria bacterium]|nr:prepilin-type N-terminal cleavage/methylation domain-containing protein [Gammaproteobacteria bacterium]